KDPQSGNDRCKPPQGRMHPCAQNAHQQEECQEAGTKADDFSQAKPGQTQSAAPVKRIILCTEPVATDMAIELKIARVDNVIGTSAADALRFWAYTLDVAGPKAAQPSPPQSAPYEFKTHAEAAAGLSAAYWRRCQEKTIGGFVGRHTSEDSDRIEAR